MMAETDISNLRDSRRDNGDADNDDGDDDDDDVGTLDTHTAVTALSILLTDLKEQQNIRGKSQQIILYNMSVFRASQKHCEKMYSFPLLFFDKILHSKYNFLPLYAD